VSLFSGRGHRHSLSTYSGVPFVIFVHPYVGYGGIQRDMQLDTARYVRRYRAAAVGTVVGYGGILLQRIC